MQMIAYALARLSEPSSYAGLGALLALAGLHFSDTELGQLAQFLAAGCGLAALILRERGVVPMIALAVLLGATLDACAPTANNVATTADATIQTACAAYQQGKAVADAAIAAGAVSGADAAKVRSIEQYGDAACANPPAGDALSTAIWFGKLVGQIATLTSISPAT